MSIRLYHSQNKGNSTYVDWGNGILIFDGNSLTNSGADGGYGTGGKYPEKLIENAPWSTTELFGQPGDLSATCANGCVVYNFGINGQTTQAMIDDGVSQIDSLYDAGKKCGVVAWEMSNDLYFNGSVANAEARFQEYCEDRQAAGFYVIVITATTRDWGGSPATSPGGDSVSAFNAKIPTLNTWLRANYTSFADKLIDLDTDVRLTDHTNSTYFFDMVHHNGTARNILGDLVAAELLTVPQ
jgi:hypothetical protein